MHYASSTPCSQYVSLRIFPIWHAIPKILKSLRRQGQPKVWEEAMNLLPRDVVRLEHDGNVDHLAFSPDGKRLVTALNMGPAEVASGQAHLWNVLTGELRAQLSHNA